MWRYAPLVIWMMIIFAGSTDALSASNSGRILKPILLWLFPHIGEPQIATIHFCVRKLAHFSEYAILAILAARAFYGSGHERLRQRWFGAALLLILLYAFGDEFHQSFEASRTASIYDSFIDIAGGVTALVLMAMRRQRRRQKASVS
jgi:VanZ family protein